MKSKFHLLCIAAIVFVISQLTRFENPIRISSDGSTLIAEHFGTTLKVPVDLPVVERVTVRFRQTMHGQGGLARLSLSSNAGPSVIKSWPAVWLWGRSWFGSLAHGEWEELTLSFNDWTHPHAWSSEYTVLEDIPAAFELDLLLVGRGGAEVVLHSPSGPVLVSINDGGIDNAFGICKAGQCPAVTSVTEPVFVNLARVVNVLSELFLPAIVLLFAYKFFLNEAPSARSWPLGYRVVTSILTIVHFGWCAYFAIEILGGVPHIPDSAVYYRQGILMSQGRLASAPLPAMPYEAFVSNASVVEGDRLVHRHANHFWPALLAVFIRLGIPQLTGAVLSTLGLLSFMAILRRRFGQGVPLVAGAFFATSPFVIVQAGEFMMHTVTMSFLLMSLFAWCKGTESKGDRWFVLAGALFGYAFGVRQLTVIGVSLAFLIAAVVVWGRRPPWRTLASFAAGAAPLALLFCIDSKIITGSYGASPHAYLWGLSVSPKNFSFGLSQMDSVFAGLLTIAYYTPWYFVFGALVCFGGIVRLDRWSVLASGSIVGLFLAYIFLNTNGIHGYGPRFMFEALPAAFFLAARGVIHGFAVRYRGPKLMWTATLTLLLGVNVLGLVRILPFYRNYNGLDTDLYSQLANLPPRESLLVVSGQSWQAMDVAAALYDPSFEGLVVIKEMPDGSHRRIIDHFKDRIVYRLNGRSLVRSEE